MQIALILTSLAALLFISADALPANSSESPIKRADQWWYGPPGDGCVVVSYISYNSDQPGAEEYFRNPMEPFCVGETGTAPDENMLTDQHENPFRGQGDDEAVMGQPRTYIVYGDLGYDKAADVVHPGAVWKAKNREP